MFRLPIVAIIIELYYVVRGFKTFPEFPVITYRNALVYFRRIATVNKEMYIDIRRLWDAVRRKRPEIQRTDSWFLLHDNAPTHRSVLAKDFIANNNAKILEHHPLT